MSHISGGTIPGGRCRATRNSSGNGRTPATARTATPAAAETRKCTGAPATAGRSRRRFLWRDARPRRPFLDRGGSTKSSSAIRYAQGAWTKRTPQMTPKQAYRMGFRHITDLAEINRIADIFLEDELDDRAQRLIEAWREGAIAAAAMLEKQRSTIQ